MQIPKVFENKPLLTDAGAAGALERAVDQVRRNLPGFTYRSQNHSSAGQFYPSCENNQWTCGFWPGEIWLSYEADGDPVFRYAGLIQSESFLRRIEQKIEVDHHDMGFLYTPSCVAAWKLTGDKRSRQAAILAAEQLLTRFQPKGGFLQAWGPMGAPENYRFIIDCLLNVPLLFWASQETGEERFRDAALQHTQTCLRHSIREDGSTYHTFFMDPVTGGPVRGVTCQGYKDDSAWARGQAWGIYGLALSYRYTRDPKCFGLFDKVLDYYLSRLPEDLVPYWDLCFTSGDEPRDSSSASIAACGMLEMAEYRDAQTAAQLKSIARQMLQSLVDSYSVRDGKVSNGQVLHGTYSKKSPYNTCTQEGVDECVSWGDYFYMEALTRLYKDWEMYW